MTGGGVAIDFEALIRALRNPADPLWGSADQRIGPAGGFRLLVNPYIKPVPRMTLPPADEFPLPPGFREDYERWLLEFFGTKEVCYLLQSTGQVFMSPRAMGMITGGGR